MTHLKVHRCGPATSIQDRGRFGWLRFGISASGAADPLALAAANTLVGNSAGCEAIELVFMGAELEVLGGAARLALAGAQMPIRIDGSAVPGHASFTLAPGQRLEIGHASAGVYALLAVQGGFDLPEVLGSKSLHRRARIGGLDGMPLAAGSVLPLVMDVPNTAHLRSMPPLALGGDEPLRVVLGPQRSYVTDAGLETFFKSTYVITDAVDRMACRLAGTPVALAGGFNILSDGIVAGSVQIPGTGQPIVMLSDRQTTGGYPKVATVIFKDIRRLMQWRPGTDVRFKLVSIDEAQDIAIADGGATDALLRTIRSAGPESVYSDVLLNRNLAGHASSASDPATWQC
jgi:5-oxoprolinase (ATP-hydrolysing) subunit C